MFTKEDNASKYALYSLILRLKDKGTHWLDTQMVTPVVEGFGGKYISRPEFLQMLSKKDWTRKRSEIF
jgi:leucyl/phenylalanyl-tRNA--protein transferase